ncbi:MAG TPA: M14 family zinc carboxypeptidase [Gemmatimonadaceae bacterium]|nr:M14 family zinc carboxypeptidase [Gemmatimonadaceae bacterium]
MTIRLLPALLLAAPLTLAAAQLPLSRRDTVGRDDRNFSFYDRGPYRPAVPRPETILGYNVGDLNTQFAMQERVLLAIADAARDRVRVEEIGATAERRRMRLYIVSAPENISRLDAIRADLDRLADPRSGSAAELDAIAGRTPAVVWINESVHGNEAPGFETAMQTLYQLAASDEPATVAALRKVIVVLNPSTNPDGHERFSVWYNSIHVGAPEPFAMEHGEPWSIQGRFNHYRFDMNRDVMTTTQLEAQALVKAMLRWHPMVAVDQHGQTYNYFFPPTAKPMNPNMGPDFQKWMEVYGKANAAAFDRYGWMYYSRDVFDFYGPFYWDSWPSLTGAIGMTYETDCGGWKGILWRREDGSLCSFRDGIAKHYVTALATIEATAARSEDRVRDFLKFRREAIEEGRTARFKRVVLVPGNDPVGAAELVSTLLRSGIEVRRASAPFSITRATAYADDATSTRRFEAGSYVIDLAQPQGRAARAVLEPTPVLDTAFARVQVEKYRRNIRRGGSAPQEGYEFYDVTAWSLPVTFGVEAWWTDETSPVSGELLALPANASSIAIPGGVTGANPARSAYLFRPESRGAAKLAYHLMNEGYRLGSSSLPLEAGGVSWPRGTFVVRVARNQATLHARIAQLAAESGVQVTGVNTAFAEVGQYGVGSESMYDLRAPRIALVGDNGISQTAYGATWWTFERRYGLTFTPVTTNWLASGNLSEFNVIVVPHGFAGSLNNILGKGGADRLRAWMQSGGTLITMGGASAWAANPDVNMTSARLVRPEKDAKPDTTGFQTPKADTTPASVRARQSERASAGVRPVEELLAVTSPGASNATPIGLPGSHFDVVLDRTHWLTSGYDTPRLTVLMEGSNFFTLSKEGVNAAVFAPTGPLTRSGFAWPDNTERLLRGTAFLIHEPVGGGHLVMFANDPLFRGWWRALDKALMNAILLGPGY